MKVTRVEVWASPVDDKPGGAAEKLNILAAAGANLQTVYGTRTADMPSGAMMAVSPLKGPEQMKAAKEAGFVKVEAANVVRVEGGDRKGRGAVITQALADAHINLAGLSAAAIGKKFVCYIMLDTAKDAAKALRVLKNLR